MDELSILHQLREAGLQPPRTLTLAVTGTCNLACPHCWVDAAPDSNAPTIAPGVLKGLIDEHVRLGGYGIRITGGEPLCHPACLDLLSLACCSGLHEVILQTNGLLVTDGVLAELQRSSAPGVSLEISLDGASPESHDLIRGAGTFRRTEELLDRLNRAGLAQRTTVLFTEMHHNLHEFPAVLALAERLGIAAVRAGTLVRGGRAASDTTIEPATPEQYLKLAEQFIRDTSFRQRYGRIGTMAAIEWLKGEALQAHHCCAFAEDAYLGADGRLYPCRLCQCDEFSVGDVHRKGLVAALKEAIPLWSRLLLLRAERERRHPAGSGRRVDGMRGAGCMGRAHGTSGDLMAPDDRLDIWRRIAALGRRSSE